MKVKGYKFGHPVFGVRDYYDFDPELSVSCDFDDTSFYIVVSDINLGGNHDLETMISGKQATCMVEVSCTYTMFRKKYIIELSDNKISIPLTEIKNKVECSIFVVAAEEIPTYKNSSVIYSARAQEFYIEHGDILGFFGDYKFELDLKGTGLDSIVKIRPKVDASESGVNYLFQEESIIVELNDAEFQQLKKYATSPDYQKILISSLLQPALIHACYKLQDDQYDEKSWCRAIKYRWEMISNGQDLPSISEIPAFVEQLLSYPTVTLLTTLGDLDERHNNQEVD